MYRLSGVVQGVGFRWWARVRAEQLGIRGDVRNEADGSVLIRAYAQGDALRRFSAELRRGPAAARVTTVKEDGWTPDQEPRTFSIAR